MSSDLASECPCPKCDAAQAGCDECGAGLPVGYRGICSSCSGVDFAQEGFPAVPTSVDLAQEGKAIAEILAALNELPEQSLYRVLDAVRGLIPPENLLNYGGQRTEGSEFPATPSELQSRAAKNIAMLGYLQGTGEDDEDVP
jgi:hypothetical protein